MIRTFAKNAASQWYPLHCGEGEVLVCLGVAGGGASAPFAPPCWRPCSDMTPFNYESWIDGSGSCCRLLWTTLKTHWAGWCHESTMCRVKRHKGGMQQESELHSVKSRLQLWELVLKCYFSFFSPLVIDLYSPFVITISHSAQRIKKNEKYEICCKRQLVTTQWLRLHALFSGTSLGQAVLCIFHNL